MGWLRKILGQNRIDPKYIGQDSSKRIAYENMANLTQQHHANPDRAYTVGYLGYDPSPEQRHTRTVRLQGQNKVSSLLTKDKEISVEQLRARKFGHILHGNRKTLVGYVPDKSAWQTSRIFSRGFFTL
tara:strand:+ start:153 stop:536 length:384 start_codon:yes stop_codon:yes gene_type:complete